MFGSNRLRVFGYRSQPVSNRGSMYIPQEHTVSTYSSDLNDFDRQFKALLERTERFTNRVEKLQSASTNIRQGFRKLNTTVHGLRNKTGDIESAFGNIDKRLGEGDEEGDTSTEIEWRRLVDQRTLIEKAVELLRLQLRRPKPLFEYSPVSASPYTADASFCQSHFSNPRSPTDKDGDKLHTLDGDVQFLDPCPELERFCPIHRKPSLPARRETLEVVPLTEAALEAFNQQNSSLEFGSILRKDAKTVDVDPLSDIDEQSESGATVVPSDRRSRTISGDFSVDGDFDKPSVGATVAERIYSKKPGQKARGAGIELGSLKHDFKSTSNVGDSNVQARVDLANVIIDCYSRPFSEKSRLSSESSRQASERTRTDTDNLRHSREARFPEAMHAVTSSGEYRRPSETSRLPSVINHQARKSSSSSDEKSCPATENNHIEKSPSSSSLANSETSSSNVALKSDSHSGSSDHSSTVVFRSTSGNRWSSNRSSIHRASSVESDLDNLAANISRSFKAPRKAWPEETVKSRGGSSSFHEYNPEKRVPLKERLAQKFQTDKKEDGRPNDEEKVDLVERASKFCRVTSVLKDSSKPKSSPMLPSVSSIPAPAKSAEAADIKSGNLSSKGSDPGKPKGDRYMYLRREKSSEDISQGENSFGNLLAAESENTFITVFDKVNKPAEVVIEQEPRSQVKPPESAHRNDSSGIVLVDNPVKPEKVDFSDSSHQETVGGIDRFDVPTIRIESVMPTAVETSSVVNDDEMTDKRRRRQTRPLDPIFYDDENEDKSSVAVSSSQAGANLTDSNGKEFVNRTVKTVVWNESSTARHTNALESSLASSVNLHEPSQEIHKVSKMSDVLLNDELVVEERMNPKVVDRNLFPIFDDDFVVPLILVDRVALYEINFPERPPEVVEDLLLSISKTCNAFALDFIKVLEELDIEDEIQACRISPASSIDSATLESVFAQLEEANEDSEISVDQRDSVIAVSFQDSIESVNFSKLDHASLFGELDKDLSASLAELSAGSARAKETENAIFEDVKAEIPRTSSVSSLPDQRSCGFTSRPKSMDAGKNYRMLRSASLEHPHESLPMKRDVKALDTSDEARNVKTSERHVYINKRSERNLPNAKSTAVPLSFPKAQLIQPSVWEEIGTLHKTEGKDQTALELLQKHLEDASKRSVLSGTSSSPHGDTQSQTKESRPVALPESRGPVAAEPKSTEAREAPVVSNLSTFTDAAVSGAYLEKSAFATGHGNGSGSEVKLGKPVKTEVHIRRKTTESLSDQLPTSASRCVAVDSSLLPTLQGHESHGLRDRAHITDIDQHYEKVCDFTMSSFLSTSKQGQVSAQQHKPMPLQEASNKGQVSSNMDAPATRFLACHGDYRQDLKPTVGLSANTTELDLESPLKYNARVVKPVDARTVLLFGPNHDVAAQATPPPTGSDGASDLRRFGTSLSLDIPEAHENQETLRSVSSPLPNLEDPSPTSIKSSCIVIRKASSSQKGSQVVSPKAVSTSSSLRFDSDKGRTHMNGSKMHCAGSSLPESSFGFDVSKVDEFVVLSEDPESLMANVSRPKRLSYREKRDRHMGFLSSENLANLSPAPSLESLPVNAVVLSLATEKMAHSMSNPTSPEPGGLTQGSPASSRDTSLSEAESFEDGSRSY